MNTIEISTEVDRELVDRAKNMAFDQRAKIICDIPETTLHQHLQKLFTKMLPNSNVEVTHGKEEYGKDLVIVGNDGLTTRVSAVVVKRGDILGQTKGTVDSVVDNVEEILSKGDQSRLAEIESQIRQAFDIDAEITSSTRALPVNEVFVVLAGKIGKNARKRLTAQLAKNNKHVQEVWDVSWLVESFTNHYPQLFFGGKPVDWLHNKIQELETSDDFFKRDKKFSEHFVDPPVATFDVDRFLAGSQLKTIQQRRKLPFSSVTKIIQNKKAVLLVGDAGSGKTSALKKIALDRYREAFQHRTMTAEVDIDVPIPLLVPARLLLDVDSLEDLIKLSCEVPEVRVRVRLSVLLVDELDLVEPSHRQTVLERAKAMASTSGVSVVIASRNVESVSTSPAGYEKFEIMPFEVNQAFRLFELVLSGKDNGHIKTLDTLRGSLDMIKAQIPMTPLSLLLLIELAERNSEIPASVTDLYERFTDMVLGRYDMERGLSVVFDYQVKKQFLGELAYAEFLAKDRLEIAPDEFNRFLANHAQRHGLNEAKLLEFLQQVERAGILKIGDRVVEFAKRSFLDYFAAVYMFNNQDEIEGMNDEVVRLHFHQLWNEVAFFVIGTRRKLNPKILMNIINYQPHQNVGQLGDEPQSADDAAMMRLYTDWQKLMVGRLLQAGWLSESSTKITGIREAFRLLPGIRQQFLEITDSYREELPTITADFWALTAADTGFRSGILRAELISFIEELGRDQPAQRLREALPALFVLRTMVSSEKLSEYAEPFVAAIEESTNLPLEDRGSAVAILQLLVKEPTLARLISKRLARMQRRYPEMFKLLLPEHQRAGFRARSVQPAPKKQNSEMKQIGHISNFKRMPKTDS